MAKYKFPPMSTAAWVLFFGAVCECLFALVFVRPVARFSEVAGTAGIIAILYSGLIASALANTLVACATGHVDATVVTV